MSTNEMVEFAIETVDGRHIGGTQLRKFDHIAHSAEFAISIGEPEFRGKGYGTEVTTLMTDIGFEMFNLNRIWLTVNEENVGARRAYEKAGFTREGLLRQNGFANGGYYNTVVMAILRNEYETRKGRD